jgi:hypothetical protein
VKIDGRSPGLFARDAAASADVAGQPVFHPSARDTRKECAPKNKKALRAAVRLERQNIRRSSVHRFSFLRTSGEGFMARIYPIVTEGARQEFLKKIRLAS